MFRIVALFAVVLLGCGPAQEGVNDDGTLTVSGVLTKIDMCQEDSSYTTVLLYFEDGRVQKTRMRFGNLFQFRLNHYNEVVIDTWSSKIVSVSQDDNQGKGVPNGDQENHPQ